MSARSSVSIEQPSVNTKTNSNSPSTSALIVHGLCSRPLLPIRNSWITFLCPSSAVPCIPRLPIRRLFRLWDNGPTTFSTRITSSPASTSPSCLKCQLLAKVKMVRLAMILIFKSKFFSFSELMNISQRCAWLTTVVKFGTLAFTTSSIAQSRRANTSESERPLSSTIWATLELSVWDLTQTSWLCLTLVSLQRVWCLTRFQKSRFLKRLNSQAKTKFWCTLLLSHKSTTRNLRATSPIWMKSKMMPFTESESQSLTLQHQFWNSVRNLES